VALCAAAIETADDSNKIVPALRIERKRGENIISLSSDASSISAGSFQQQFLVEQQRGSKEDINPC
jgi:hypothetical protein